MFNISEQSHSHSFSMDQMYKIYIRQKIDHNYTDNTFEMKYDCHFYVMSVNHVTSKAAYGSDYKGILDNLTIFFPTFSTSCIFCLEIMVYGIGLVYIM